MLAPSLPVLLYSIVYSFWTCRFWRDKSDHKRRGLSLQRHSGLVDSAANNEAMCDQSPCLSWSLINPFQSPVHPLQSQSSPYESSEGLYSEIQIMKVRSLVFQLLLYPQYAQHAQLRLLIIGWNSQLEICSWRSDSYDSRLPISEAQRTVRLFEALTIHTIPLFDHCEARSINWSPMGSAWPGSLMYSVQREVIGWDALDVKLSQPACIGVENKVCFSGWGA